MDISVTIVTSNRARKLATALEALSNQDFPSNNFEVIVADNGSTDNTELIAQESSSKFKNFRYIYDARPGQLVGWHRSLFEAEGEITCFIDDDIIPSNNWLSALADAYSDPTVGMATGPIKLRTSCKDLPSWLEYMKLGEPGSQTLPYLTLLDFGNVVRDIPGNFVWGSNFSVRKSLLLDVGGFHPGAMPARLLHYYGDGEIFVGREVGQRGYRTIYHPYAEVEHDISKERFTMKAVRSKFMTSGCARSFQTLRATGQVFEIPDPEELLELSNRYFNNPDQVPEELKQVVQFALRDGMCRQLHAFEVDSHFREWVLKENYLDLDSCYENPTLKSFSLPNRDKTDWRLSN